MFCLLHCIEKNKITFNYYTMFRLMRVNQESNVIWVNIFLKKPKYFKLCLGEILKKYFNRSKTSVHGKKMFHCKLVNVEIVLL